MKELDFLKIIEQTLDKSSHLGDDCAYLKDLNLVLTVDNLVEDVHFTLKSISAYQLGIKAMLVNISDILASGAVPKYALIGLSGGLSGSLNEDFITDFYRGVNEICKKYDMEVVGGDLTSGEKIFVSISMLGSTIGRNISSRAAAYPGYIVAVAGDHGSSRAGLELLGKGLQEPRKLIDAHICPVLYPEISNLISKNLKTPYAMTDTSDGLADALYKISCAAKVSFEIDFNKIPYAPDLESVTSDIQNYVLWGGEDYGLLVCMNEEDFTRLNADGLVKIGTVKERNLAYNVKVLYGKDFLLIDDETYEEYSYKHFYGAI